jgi:hypothetical protein
VTLEELFAPDDNDLFAAPKWDAQELALLRHHTQGCELCQRDAFCTECFHLEATLRRIRLGKAPTIAQRVDRLLSQAAVMENIAARNHCLHVKCAGPMNRADDLMNLAVALDRGYSWALTECVQYLGV